MPPQLALLPEEDAASGRRYELMLADAYAKTGQPARAAGQLRQLLARTPAGEGRGDTERLEVLCRLADTQLRLDEAHAAKEVEARIERVRSGSEAEPASAPPRRTASVLQLDVLSEQAVQDEEQAEHSTSQTLLQICSGA